MIFKAEKRTGKLTTRFRFKGDDKQNGVERRKLEAEKIGPYSDDQSKNITHTCGTSPIKFNKNKQLIIRHNLLSQN